MKNEELRPHEWIALATFFLILALISKIAWNAPANRWPQKERLPVLPPQEQIVITISGAVNQEGRYHFPKGTTIKEALEEVQIKPDADLSKLQFEKPLKTGQRLKIPHKKQKKH